MSRFLYPIRRLEVKPWIKYWMIKRTAGTLSEILENLTSPITLNNSLRRKFKIFEIGGNSVQDGTPTLESSVLIQNVTGTVDVKVENKNLYNPNTLINGYTINTSTGEIIVGATKSITPLINVKENQEYIVWGYTTAMRVAFYDKDNGFISTQAKTSAPGSGFTFDTPSETKYLRLTGETSYFNNNVQLEEGSKTEFIAHEEQTVAFPLLEGQVLHLGDTLEDDGVHQRRFTKVFDGTETFEQFQAFGNYYRTRLSLLNAKTFTTNDDNGQLSSHFTYSKSGALGSEAQANKGSFAQYHDSDKFYFVFEQTSIANFKAWLEQQYANGTPVKVEYELAEEIIVPYTETQQEAYNKIKKLYSYKGTTHISSDNEPSPIFKIQYVKEDANESSNND